MDSSASSGALGTTTIFVRSTERERRLERYELQSMARLCLPSERVAGCLRTVVHGAGGPGIWHEEANKRAKYGGLLVCGSVWVCPVCAAAIAERRRQDLASVVDGARGQGFEVGLATLTFRHERRMALGVSLASLLYAYRTLQRQRVYELVKTANGVVGFVKSLEVTWGFENGWHPHLHLLVFRRPGVGSWEEFEGSLSKSWLRALWGEKLSGEQPFAVRVAPAGDEVSDYVAKYGHDSAKRAWGAADEMTKWHIKRGRTPESGALRLSPFDLLRWASDTGESEPVALFREFAGAFKGRHQLQVSRGLRDTLGAVLGLSDEEAASWIDSDAVLLATLTAEEWRLVNYYQVRGVLLEEAGQGGYAAMRRLLDSLLQT